MQRNTDKLTLDEVIAHLESNDPKFKFLVLKNITDFPKLNIKGQLEKFIAALGKNSTLECLMLDVIFLHLANCTKETVLSITDAIQDHPNLFSLKIDTARCSSEWETIILILLASLTNKKQWIDFEIDIAFVSHVFFKELGSCLLKQDQIQYLSIQTAAQTVDSNHPDYIKPNDVQSLFRAVSQQKQLKKCSFDFPKFNEKGEIAFCAAISEIKNITQFKLRYYEAADGDSVINVALEEFLKNNHKLCELDLTLQCTSLSMIINKIQYLFGLTKLHLVNYRFSTDDFQLLCDNWQKWHLKISDLMLGNQCRYLHQEVLDRDQAMKSIENLIDGNTNLKYLTLDFQILSMANSKSLQTILSDSKRCYLYYLHSYFSFYIGEDDVCRIALNNKNFMYLKICGYARGLSHILDANKWQHYNQFITEIMLVCQAYWVNSDDENRSNLALLPKEIFAIILSFLSVGRGFYKKNDEDTLACSQLIFDNFNRRRDDKSQYWWHQSIFYNKKSKEIFKTKADNAVNSEVTVKHPLRVCHIIS